MSTENCNLDLRKDGDYNIIFQTNRTLKQIFQATFFSGTTELPFDFTPYSGAVLQVRVKPDYPNVLLEFNTIDGSILLGVNGEFELVKTADEMNIRFGNYVYDMFLIESTAPDTKREFLRGDFILKDDVSK